MAAKTTQSVHVWRQRTKVKRKGVHAKTKTSKNKCSTNYTKPYNAQGK